MFGYLRFVLAFFVLISHVNVRFSGLNPGVIAVVIFYILAGHVVSHLWTDIIPQGPGKLYRFYRDRILRIFPLYIYVAVLTIVFLAVTGYGEPVFPLPRIIGNFTIIPLNFYMVMDTTILTSPDWCLIPPAWSLGAEIQAYILLPLVFMRGSLKILLVKILLVLVSFCVYMAANFSMINTDYFGYRLIPGVFFIFVLGASIQSTKNKSTKNPIKNSRFDMLYPWITWLAIAISGLVFMEKQLFCPGYTRETFIGLFIGIPLVYLLDRVPVKIPGNAVLGSLSYGIFLAHFLVIWWVEYTGLIKETSAMYIPGITLGAVFIAFSGVFFIESNVDSIRKK